MDVNSIIETVLKLNWQTILAMFTITWYFTHGLKNSLILIEKRIDTLEERMFQLATGKSLQQAILEEKMKKEENK